MIASLYFFGSLVELFETGIRRFGSYSKRFGTAGLSMYGLNLERDFYSLLTVSRFCFISKRCFLIVDTTRPDSSSDLTRSMNG